MNQNEEQLEDIGQTAERLGLSYHAVYHAVRNGDLKSTKAVVEIVAIRRSDADHWYANRKSLSKKRGPKKNRNIIPEQS